MLNAQIQKRPPLEAAQLKRGASMDLMAYIKTCDPNYQCSEVHYQIAEIMQQVREKKLTRVIISMPPRHGKSTLISQEFPSWVMGIDDDKKPQFAVTSYSSDLPKDHSRVVQDRLLSTAYQTLFKTRLRNTKNATGEWFTKKGSKYLALGIGGGFTGKGADYLIIDDPFKDYSEAFSETVRDTVWNWFLSTAYTRLSKDGCIIIIMTRWHVDDLVGRIMDPSRREQMKDSGIDENWQWFNFEGLAKQNDRLGRKPGQALFPERFDESWMKTRYAVLGSFLSSAMYDGNPVPQGGKYASREWFQVIGRDKVPSGLRHMRFWDLATSEDTSADFTAGIRGALGPDLKDPKQEALYLMDMVTGRWNWPPARQRIITTAKSEKIYCGVEAVGGFKTTYQNLKEVAAREAPEVLWKEVNVDKDKLTRALPWIALAESRKVYVVADDWNTSFFNQLEAFPDGKNDDMVDSVSGLYALLKGVPRIILI